MLTFALLFTVVRLIKAQKQMCLLSRPYISTLIRFRQTPLREFLKARVLLLVRKLPRILTENTSFPAFFFLHTLKEETSKVCLDFSNSIGRVPHQSIGIIEFYAGEHTLWLRVPVSLPGEPVASKNPLIQSTWSGSA